MCSVLYKMHVEELFSEIIIFSICERTLVSRTCFVTLSFIVRLSHNEHLNQKFEVFKISIYFILMVTVCFYQYCRLVRFIHILIFIVFFLFYMYYFVSCCFFSALFFRMPMTRGFRKMCKYNNNNNNNKGNENK